MEVPWWVFWDGLIVIFATFQTGRNKHPKTGAAKDDAKDGHCRSGKREKDNRVSQEVRVQLLVQGQVYWSSLSVGQKQLSPKESKL